MTVSVDLMTEVIWTKETTMLAQSISNISGQVKQSSPLNKNLYIYFRVYFYFKVTV